MRKHLLGLMLIAGLAGCSSESDIELNGTSEAAAQRGPSDALPTQASLAAARGSASHFASLPDRGELLSYGGVRKVRKSGAYTYHPVAISEAHALNAIGSGRMVVNMPDGEALQFEYERHEEQPDGNWTWIGRDADGSSAVLTFGEKAVFGMVSKGDDYYRVRTDRTGAWVVATDRSLVASGGGRREDGHDYLLPPERGLLTAASSNGVAKAAATAKAEGTQKAAAVVDLVIGYSNGLAAIYGGQAQAATFVASLAAVTNQAYANSGVNMRLRVVHALQVNYADTSDNQDALQQMTGYDADTQQPIPVNSAFNALREARDEYGADLVAFVRQYREPEQDGCGIAWLLGMNQSGITAADDAEFGYAVISDGEDLDESDGNTYFCSDFSLAHELGHLMGQAHNEEDANAGGAHAYSYGYRESSASGFFTIMAYPSGDAQAEIPYFANPAVNFATGRPTGVANQSDNVRSMNITMPIVANFRATVVPLNEGVRNDHNGDGRSDLLWWNPANRLITYWHQSGSTTIAKLAAVRQSAGYALVATGDFDGDGRSGDLVWTNASQIQLWLSSGNAFTIHNLGALPAGWRVVGSGDVDGDGRSDILWRRNADGLFTYWLMNGAQVRSRAQGYLAGNNYQIKGIGDLNGDGRTDVIWSNNVNILAWLGTSTGGFTQSIVSAHPAGWDIVGVGDVNADLKSDILFRRRNDGLFTYWLLDGATVTSKAAGFRAGKDFVITSLGDLNSDGRLDIVWTNLKNVLVWSGTSSGFSQAIVAGGYPRGWVMLDPRFR